MIFVMALTNQPENGWSSTDEEAHLGLSELIRYIFESVV